MFHPYPWSEEETAVILNGSSMTIHELMAALPTRTKKSIQNRLYECRVFIKSSRKLAPWSEEQIQFLKDNHETMTVSKIARKLGHSYTSACRIAMKLGIKSKKDRKAFNRPRTTWSNHDRDMLKWYANDLTIAQIAAKLNRTKQAVSCMASDLGITLIYGNHTLKQVAKYLQVSVRTVTKHRDALGQKWGRMLKDEHTRSPGANFDDIREIAQAIIDDGQPNVRASARHLFQVIKTDPLLGQAHLKERLA